MRPRAKVIRYFAIALAWGISWGVGAGLIILLGEKFILGLTPGQFVFSHILITSFFRLAFFGMIVGMTSTFYFTMQSTDELNSDQGFRVILNGAMLVVIAHHLLNNSMRDRMGMATYSFGLELAVLGGIGAACAALTLRLARRERALHLAAGPVTTRIPSGEERDRRRLH